MLYGIFGYKVRVGQALREFVIRNGSEAGFLGICSGRIESGESSSGMLVNQVRMGEFVRDLW